MTGKQNNTSMVGNRETGCRQRGRGWRIAGWAGVALTLLLVPLVAMQFSAGWNWDLFDFGFAFVLLFGTGLTYELVASKMAHRAYKRAVGVAGGAVLLLVWLNGAVGLIGDDEAINVLYLGVLGVGLLGALSTRFAPRGMARTAFAMAITQLLVPVIVLLIPTLRGALLEPPSVMGVIGLNLCFTALFVGAALLFRQAAQAQLTASPRTD
ncbi:MAG: hypothetical protein R2867_45000 [Caldilineaceae bacterium]